MSDKPVTEQPRSSLYSPMHQNYGTTFGDKGARELECLAGLDQLIIEQQLELFEVMTGIETQNKYRVLNNQRQPLFFVGEESDCCNRVWCKQNRGFIFHVYDVRSPGGSQETMRIERPFLCCKGCCWCADGCSKYPIYVKDVYDQTMGIIRMTNFCCAPRFGIFDEYETLLYRVSGDCCRIQGPCCAGDINFPIMRAGEHVQVANIAKRWTNCMRECVSKADTFVLTFPVDMSVSHKALLFAAVFLIDISLYEWEKKKSM